MELILKEDLPKKLLSVLQGGKKNLTETIYKVIYFEQEKDNVLFVIIQFSIEIKRHCKHKAMLNLVWLR